MPDSRSTPWPMRARIAIVAAAALVITLAGLIACERYHTLVHGHHQCSLDERPIHPEMKVRVLLEGGTRPSDGCCLRCAINESIQSGKIVRVISVTDYNTHAAIAPEKATYVTGGDVAPCAGPALEPAPGRHGVEMKAWDRCAPSSIAFAREDDARAFQRTHGGRIENWEQVIGQARLVAR